MVKRYSAFRTGNGDIDRNLSTLQLIINQLSRVPLVNGTLLKDKTVETSNTVINHGLGREIQGWIIVDTDGFGVVKKVESDKRTITLVSDMEVTVSLWVF